MKSGVQKKLVIPYNLSELSNNKMYVCQVVVLDFDKTVMTNILLTYSKIKELLDKHKSNGKGCREKFSTFSLHLYFDSLLVYYQ